MFNYDEKSATERLEKKMVSEETGELLISPELAEMVSAIANAYDDAIDDLLSQIYVIEQDIDVLASAIAEYKYQDEYYRKDESNSEYRRIQAREARRRMSAIIRDVYAREVDSVARPFFEEDDN